VYYRFVWKNSQCRVHLDPISGYQDDLIFLVDDCCNFENQLGDYKR